MNRVNLVRQITLVLIVTLGSVGFSADFRYGDVAVSDGKRSARVPQSGRHKLRILTPPNDACADAVEIPTGTHDGSLASGTLDGSSTCGGEISDVWYRVVSPGDGNLFVDTCGTTNGDCGETMIASRLRRSRR